MAKIEKLSDQNIYVTFIIYIMPYLGNHEQLKISIHVYKNHSRCICTRIYKFKYVQILVSYSKNYVILTLYLLIEIWKGHMLSSFVL